MIDYFKCIYVLGVKYVFCFFMIILELRVYMYIYFKNSMLGGIF